MTPLRKVGPDFLLVELTPAGVAMAKGSPVRISDGRISVLLTPGGDPVKVARFEWDMLLRDHTSVSGAKVVQIYIPPAAAPSPAQPQASKPQPEEKV